MSDPMIAISTITHNIIRGTFGYLMTTRKIRITRDIQGEEGVVLDLDNFGPHYMRTIITIIIIFTWHSKPLPSGDLSLCPGAPTTPVMTERKSCKMKR